MAADTTMSSSEVFDLNRSYTLTEWTTQATKAPLSIERADGIYLFDHDPRRYVDFNAQLMNVNLGHQHPKVIEVIRKQSELLCYASPRMVTRPRGELGALLSEVTPGARHEYGVWNIR